MQCDVRILEPPEQQQQVAYEDRVLLDLESALKKPILPPNPNFFCCFSKFHITTVAKCLSIAYALLYGLLCFVCWRSDHAVSFLTAVTVATSVGGCTIYATFKWSKICLIPFALLQVMLVLYVFICIGVLFYTVASPYSTYVYAALHASNINRLMMLNTRISLLFWYEYQFIAEVDRFLKTIRKTSSHASKDDPANGGNGKSRMQL